MRRGPDLTPKASGPRKKKSASKPKDDAVDLYARLRRDAETEDRNRAVRAAKNNPEDRVVFRNPGIPAPPPGNLPGHNVQTGGQWADPIGQALLRGASPVDPKLAAMASVAARSAAPSGAPTHQWRDPIGEALLRGASPASGPPVAAPLPSIEEQLGLAPIDHGTYMQPFDQAESAARGAFDAVRPVIDTNYTDLVGRLQGGSADAQGEFARNRAALEAQLSASRNELQGIGAQQLASPHITDPTLRSGAEAEIASRAMAAQQASDGRLGLADRFADIQRQSNDSRISDTQLAKSNALANASSNLQQLLGDIGVKRAGAEQQYQSDLQSRTAQLADIKRQQAEEERKIHDQYLGEIDSAKMSPKKWWNSGGEAAVARTYPRAYDAYRQILDGHGAQGADDGDGPRLPPVKGKGVVAMNEALRRLALIAPMMREDGLNPAKIRQWLEATYNDWDETLPDDVRQRIDRKYGF